MADLARIGIKDRHEPKALLGEAAIGGEGRAEVPGPHQKNIPGAIGAQDMPNLGDQLANVISDSTLAKLAEVRKVLADLRGGELEGLGKLPRGDRALVGS